MPPQRSSPLQVLNATPERRSPAHATPKPSQPIRTSPIHSPCLSPVGSPSNDEEDVVGSPNASWCNRRPDDEEFSDDFYSLVRDWLADGSESSLPDLLRFNKLTDKEKSAFYTYAER